MNAKQNHLQVDLTNLFRIIDDCSELIQTSKNIDVVMNRLELVCQKSYTLKQMEQNGFYDGKISSDECLNIFVKNKDALICKAIKRNLDDVLQNTTPKNIYKIKEFFSHLQKYDIEFSENVKDYVLQLQTICEKELK